MGRNLERNAVFRPIRPVFLFIPLVAYRHYVYTVYTPENARIHRPILR